MSRDRKKSYESVSVEENDISVRPVAPEDAPLIAWQRARMWEEMGDLPPEHFEPLRARAEVQFRDLLRAGDYVGWFAAPSAEPEKVVAGAGIFLRPSLPSPRKVSGATVGVTTGKLGLLINVFTEPEWRRRGIAMLLMQRAIEWSREQQIDRLILHASDAGRPLYAKMGFVPTNEMRLANL